MLEATESHKTADDDRSCSTCSIRSSAMAASHSGGLPPSSASHSA